MLGMQEDMKKRGIFQPLFSFALIPADFPSFSAS
jgi:hypothetical protein